LAPFTLANLFNDKESITADPVDTGNVYAAWDRIESPNNNPVTPPQAYAHALAFRGPTWFARSTNNGASWEPARKIFEPQPSRVQTIGNQIVVLPDGTLVDGFNYITGSNGQDIHRGDNAAVIFSTDQGTTWSSNPTIIANMGDVGVRDPEPVNCLGDNTPATPCLLVRTGDILPDFAVDYSTGPTKGTCTPSGRHTGRRRCSSSARPSGSMTRSCSRVRPTAGIIGRRPSR
jgi:hypothetical protein